jgi:Putative Ig domain
LWGSGVNPTALGIDSYPPLPAGTQNYPFQANLNAVGGKAPYTWTLATGSTLPAGLSLSTSGLISGSIASSVAVGNYTFTARAADSSTVQGKACKAFTLPVGAYSGSVGQHDPSPRRIRAIDKMWPPHFSARRASNVFRPQGECYDKYVRLKIVARARSTTLLSSSMAEHPAVNRRVVGSNPT